MSVMNVALGTRAPLTRPQRRTLAIGVGLAVAAHLAALGLVMQARGARAIWEPTPEPFVITMAPLPAPPPPPAHPRAERSKPAEIADPTPKAVVQTREPQPSQAAATSELAANPAGAKEPTTGPAPTGVAGPADSPAQAKTDPVVRAADWARRPTAADLVRFYPRRAEDLALEGSTRVTCVVSAEGFADGCKVESESPAGYGFGDAALRMVKTFRFRPLTVDGQAKPGGVIHIPLRWTLPN